MKLRVLFLALLSAGLLAACGDSTDAVASDPNAIPLQFAGITSKGRVKNADVKAYEVDANGQRGATHVASATSSSTAGAEGSYNLAFTGKKGATYVVEVTATAATTEINEISGTDQRLPAGFKMRTAVVAPEVAPSAPLQATVTPFSEMSVAAAERAAGGLKKENVQQAITTVSSMLGFNPIEVKLEGDANKRKLEDLLTTVAAIANGGTTVGGTNLATQKTAFGCDGKTGGDAVQCVVEKLSSKASLKEVKLSDSNVSAALASAISVAAPASEIKAVVQANLTCQGDACSAPAPTVYTAVQAAKKLFADLRTTIKADLTAMGAKESSTPGVNDSAYLQATAMKTALDQAVMPLGMLNKQLEAISGCLRWQDSTPIDPNSGLRDLPDGSTYGCSLSDGKLGVGINYATKEFSSGLVVNSATYHKMRVRQTFGIQPGASGSYSYGFKSGIYLYASASDAPGSVDSPSDAFPDLVQQDASAGTIVIQRDANGLITTVSVNGKLPGKYKYGFANIPSSATSVVGYISGGRNVKKLEIDGVWTTNANLSNGGGQVNGGVAPTFAGTVNVFHAGSQSLTPDEKLALNFSASINITNGNGKPASLNVSKLEWSSNTAKLLGSVELKDFVTYQGDYNPSSMTFTGSLANSTGGGSIDVPFLTGTLAATASGFAQVIGPEGPGNSPAVSLTFNGTLAAPSRPTLALSIGAQGTSYDGPTSVTAQFKSTTSGSDKYAITMSANKSTGTVTLTESSSNLSMSWVKDVPTVDVKKGNDKVGEVNMNEGKIYYIDRSFESL